LGTEKCPVQCLDVKTIDDFISNVIHVTSKATTYRNVILM